MDLQKTIDIIIEQEQKEIRVYILFASGVIACFLILLSVNIYIYFINDIAATLTLKEIAAAISNFLALAAGYIPLQQIIKRKKKVRYFDKILRIGVLDCDPDKEKYADLINKAIENGLKD